MWTSRQLWYALRLRFAPLYNKYAEAIGPLGKLPQKEGSKKFGELVAGIDNDATKMLPELLQPAQLKRYQQMVFQRRKEKVLTDPEVLLKLKLTDDQKARVKEISDQRAKKFADLETFTPGTVDDLWAEQREKTFAILSAEQKAIWEDLVGKPFELKPGWIVE